jgi:hypothetical protein
MSYTDTDVAKLILNLLTKAQFDTSSKSPLELWFTTDEGFLPDTTKFGAGLSMSVDPSTYVLTLQLKDQDGNALGTAQTVDLPIESLILSVTYDSINKRLVITLQNGNVVYVPLGDLISGLQTEITSSNKLDADLVDDSTSLNKFVTAAEKTSIANAVQKSGGTMTGDLETPGVITSTLWFKEGPLSTYAWSSVDVPNNNIYFGNINYNNVLRGSSLKYMEPSGTLYDVRTSKGFIQGRAGWTWEYDEDLQKYYGQVELSSYIPYTDKKYLILFGVAREDFWKYINTYGHFIYSSTTRKLYIYFDQQLYTDLHTSNPAVDFTAIPLDSSFKQNIAIFAPRAIDVANEWWDGDDYPSNTYPQKTLDRLLAAKQDTLLSGTNIKTINGNSILGSGDLVIGGGGGSYTAGTGIIIQNDEISVDGETANELDTETTQELDTETTQELDTEAVNEVSLATVATSGAYGDLSGTPTNFTGADGINAGTTGLVPAPAATDNDKFLKGDGTWGTPSGGGGNYVTTDTAQNITAKKTFVGEKAIYFKQSAAADKLGFTLFDGSDAELAAFEYRPSTIDGNPLLNINAAQAGNIWLGFRYWTNINIVAPKPANGTYYIPVIVSNGSTTVTANNAGTVNISSLIPTIATSVSSASTNSETVGAKLFYDTCGDIETLINAL